MIICKSCKAAVDSPTRNEIESEKCVDCIPAEDICSCGYVDGSFACKIRHVQMNSGDAKAFKDISANRGNNFGLKESPKR